MYRLFVDREMQSHVRGAVLLDGLQVTGRRAMPTLLAAEPLATNPSELARALDLAGTLVFAGMNFAFLRRTVKLK
jgi:hypothetical protein